MSLLVAIVVGALAALMLGGRVANAAEVSFRFWWLLFVGVALQAAPTLLDVSSDAAFVWVVGSYVALGGFVVANLRLVGMPIVLIGLAMNALVIVANHGMPVGVDAVLAVGASPDEDLAAQVQDNKHHLETGDEQFMFLGDIIPLRPTGEILSFGDLVLAAGTGNVVFRLLKPARVARRGRDQVIDLRSTSTRQPADTLV